jgi:hypothetical protein
VAIPRALGAADDDPLRALHHGHPYGKEPWRQAHQLISWLAQPGDLVLLHPGYLHLVWDYYDRGVLDVIQLPRTPLDAADIGARWGTDLDARTRVFLVLAHEETEDADHYFHALEALLAERWPAQGMARFQAVAPILFDRSWGVRVAAFNRR